MRVGKAYTVIDTGEHGIVAVVNLQNADTKLLKLIKLTEAADWRSYEEDDVIGWFDFNEVTEITEDDYNKATNNAFIRAKRGNQ